jgi:hypothetical protein
MLWHTRSCECHVINNPEPVTFFGVWIREPLRCTHLTGHHPCVTWRIREAYVSAGPVSSVIVIPSLSHCSYLLTTFFFLSYKQNRNDIKLFASPARHLRARVILIASRSRSRSLDICVTCGLRVGGSCVHVCSWRGAMTAAFCFYRSPSCST